MSWTSTLPGPLYATALLPAMSYSFVECAGRSETDGARWIGGTYGRAEHRSTAVVRTIDAWGRSAAPGRPVFDANTGVGTQQPDGAGCARAAQDRAEVPMPPTVG